MANARPQNAQPQPATNGPRPRILRIGVLLGGKIVEERLIRERTAVSIGQSMRNTFSIPIEGLPLEFTLFALDERGKYHLRFLAKMDGRLSDSGGQVNTLDALKARGATQAGEYWQVPLGDNARGKLSLGDLTVLFQFVTEPPRQPKPMLPASVRGTFADRFDPQLLAILGISIVLHFAVVIIALLGDIEDDSIAAKAYNLEFHPEKYNVTPEEPVKPEETEGSGAGSGAKDDKKPEKPSPRPNPNTGTSKPKEDPGMSAEDVAAMADELTRMGKNGTSDNDMDSRRPQGDLGKEIEGIKEGNQKVGIGGASNRGPRGDGDPRIGTGQGPKIDGPGSVTSAGGGKEPEKSPQGRISVGSKSGGDDSTLSPDAVLSRIQTAYMAGLKRCYKQYLNKEASARGGVILSFTVNETGRVVSGEAKGFAGEVDTCIEGLMASWRFPAPKDKDGDATDANFAITLQLVPD